MIVLKEPIEFEWDEGNSDKNEKHNVRAKEIEDVFFDNKRFIFTDRVHSGNEERLRILGKTREGRLLFVVFTIRNEKVRVISARDINKKEVYLYEKKASTTRVQK